MIPIKSFAVHLLLLSLLQLLALNPTSVAAVDVPAALEPWTSWVLHDRPEHACPPDFNDGTHRRCWWPSRLTIDIGDTGGLFEQQVTVYAPSWVSLPGDARHWPESVAGESGRMAVTARKKRPVTWLTPGTYRIKGAFVWDQLPEAISVPLSVGLLSLRLNGRDIDDPDVDKTGRLRLQADRRAQHRDDRMTMTLFRLIEDDIPMRIVTRILMHVAGRSREIRLPSVLPADSTVMAVDSPLPLRLSDNDDLLIQVRPGRWDLRVTVRLHDVINVLSPGPVDYGAEIWSFRAYHQLRMVTLSGAPTVEPTRTQMPDEWKALPAYRIEPGSRLTVEEIRRGDPDPAPNQLQLQRTWWLDFDGAGFTLHDRLTGTLSQTWHLAMNAPVELGRVAVDGQDRLITRQGDQPGVQLRRGRLNLEADSRMPRTSSSLPAVGWDHNVQRAAGVLNLPPGWSLFSASGVDVPPTTWLQRWTLLDLFLLLIIAISTYQLYGRSAGVVALLGLVLMFHEPGAPRHVWLHLLATTALLKYLPDGWFRKIIRLWAGAALIALVIIALPFMVQQIRTAVYPQLEIGGAGGLRTTRGLSETVLHDAQAPAPAATMARRPMTKALKRAADAEAVPTATREQERTLAQNDPDALIQTGPGLPSWQWRRVSLRWNGPVDRTQQIHLRLISPFQNMMIGIARVILLFILILVFLNARRWKHYLPTIKADTATTAVLTALLLLPTAGAQAQPPDADFPPQHLLEELQQRLLEPPVCLPRCADVSRVELAATPDQLRLILQIHALTDTAIPLPAGRGTWIPARITMDNTPVQRIAQDDHGVLWMVLPAGVHQVKLTGSPGGSDEIRIAFPIRPHKGTYAGVGWVAQGIHPDGTVDTSIVLARMQSERATRRTMPKADIPPFFEIAHTLRLGIQWEVVSHIRRKTEPGTPVILSVPLLPGAAVTTAGVHVDAGVAQIALGPNEVESRFTSSLPIAASIQLTAPDDVPWTEVWTLDAAAMWRCELSGLTPVHHQDAGSQWRPQWRPRSGEQVTITISRPPAVSGRSVTVDGARLEMTPGQRFIQSTLALNLRSSKGGHHQIELPDQANLQIVRIDGKRLPIRQDGRLVSLPLEPGGHAVHLEWQQLTDSLIRLTGPRVQVGDAAVNAAVTFKMPDHRWILFVGGPTLGPAVLFWSYVLVAVLFAIGLGKTQTTPLHTRQWLLLGLGLTQVPPPVAVLVVGWLLALGYRCKHEAPQKPLLFNGMQLMLVAMTLIALIGLYVAIERGLLGIPDMQIAGNHSTRLQLNWTQDRIDGLLPVPWAVSLPLWVYRLLMLAWSLWLAFSLLAWLRWGWGCFSKDHLWKPVQWRRRRKASPPKTAEHPAADQPAPSDPA